MTIYPRSSIQITNNKRLRIWQNHYVIKLINNQPDIDTKYFYAKDPYETKYKLLINKRESTGQKHFNEPKAFVDSPNDMNDVHENIHNTI